MKLTSTAAEDLEHDSLKEHGAVCFELLFIVATDTV